MTDERFHLLVEKHLEGTLTEEEARELLEAPESRLLEEVLLASLLARLHRPAAHLAPRVLAALRPESEKAEMARRILGELPPPARRQSRWLLLGLGVAVAACLPILGIVGWLLGGVHAPGSSPSWAALADPTVAAAVSRAAGFLKKAPMPDCRWQAPMPADELVLFALSHAGVPESDPFFRSLFDRVLAAKLKRTYNVSVRAMLLAKLDPARHQEGLAACAKFLVENQCVNGQWSYGVEAPGPSAPLNGNNSCSIFAALGLRACHDAGIAIPRETLERAARWWRECRRPYPDVGEGEVAGWCYTREESPHRPYGSMTAGAVAALVIEDTLLGDDWRKDPVAQAGFRWLAKYFSVSENFGPVEELMAKELVSDTPNPKTELYYYLWALGSAGAVLGVDKMGGRDWYLEGARELVLGQRPDGSWYGGAKRCQPVYDTCFAILFLTRWARPF